MAIRNIFEGAAQGLLGKNLKRVAGNIASLIDGVSRVSSGDFSGITRSKNATNSLAFPLDINNVDPGTGGNHGHYIMFYINEQTNATLKFDNIRNDSGRLYGIENMQKHLKDKLGFTGNFDNIFDTKTGKFKQKATENQKQIFDAPGGVNDLLFGEGSEKYKKGFGGASTALKTGDINTKTYGTRKTFKQTISVDRRPTKRLDSVITMFMPADVKVKYQANYNDATIGVGTQFFSQTVGNQTDTGATGDVVQANAKEVLAGAAANGIANLLGALPPLAGTKEAIELGLGAIISDRMELSFKGVDKRKFQYTFKMLPRSEDEANEVKKIIEMFKFHMLPEMVGGNLRGRLMHYPSTFDIKYMFQNSENNYINKVSECYLETMDVDYGGDRYRTHASNDAGAPPVETSMTLNFAEIELITRERATEGF